MKVRDIKVGETYYNYWYGELMIDSIEPADRAKGTYFPSIIVTVKDTGRQMSFSPESIITTEKYQAEMRMQELGTQETKEHLETIKQAVGGGIGTYGDVGEDWVRVLFTEPAAERVLELCGAKPIPDDRRPSLVDGDDEEGWRQMCFLLSQRLRRAFGAGRSSRYPSSGLQHPYVAELTFSGDIDQAAAKISGRAEEDSSALSELLV